MQRKLLQFTIAIACMVPISAGIYGVVMGMGTELDSHFRYLSGLLFAIGIAFASTITKIQKHRARFGLLTLIVFIGGLARLYGVMISGEINNIIIFALIMELVITPLLCWWQRSVSA